MPESAVETRLSRVAALQRVLGRPVVFAFCAMMGLFTLSLSLMEPSLPLVFEARFGFGPREMGRTFLLVGLILVLVQGGLVGRLAPVLGEGALVKAGMLAMAVGLLVLAFGGTVGVATFGVACAAVGAGLTSASLASLTSRRAGSEERGAVMGVFQSAQALARAIGPMIAGVMFEMNSAAPFLAGGLIVFGLVGWFVMIGRRVANEAS